MAKEPRLPPLKPARVVRALIACGFTVKRQTGSHIFLTRPGLNAVVLVSRHNRDLPPGHVRDILRSAEVTPAEFLKHV